MHSQGPATIDVAHGAWFGFCTSAFGDNLAAMWAPTTKTAEVITDQLDPVTWKNVAQRTGVLGITGTSIGSAPSPRSCLVVGLRTGLPTRAGRGRMYLPSPSGSHYTAEGKFVQADCDTIANDFANAILTMKVLVTPVIAHRATKTWDTIINVTVGNIPGTQRRRTNKDSQTYSSAGA